MFRRQVLCILTKRLSLIDCLSQVLLSLSLVNVLCYLSYAVVIFCLSCREVKIAWCNRAQLTDTRGTVGPLLQPRVVREFGFTILSASLMNWNNKFLFGIEHHFTLNLILFIWQQGSSSVLNQFRVDLIIPGLVAVQLVKNSVILFVWNGGPFHLLRRKILSESVNGGRLTVLVVSSVRKWQFLNLNHRLCVYE
jgi:hypothetical protein